MQKLQTEQMGLILGAILVGVVIAVLITMIHVSAATETQDHIVALVDSTTGHIISDKKSAQAIFIPASDVNGASNSDGHAFDLYYQDKNQNGYFFEYCYRSAANDCLAGQPMNTLVDYSYPSWRSLVRNGGSNAGVAIAQGPIDDLTTFAIKTYAGGAQISTLPEIASYASGHPISCSPRVYHWAYPGVTSSTCTVYRLTVGAGPEQVAANLVDSLIPFQQTIINGTKTPPPNSLTLSPASLSFRNPLDVAHSFIAAESNYGNRSTNPAQVYTLSPGDCSDNGSSGYPAGRNDATYAPGSPVTPTNNGSGQASVSVAPVKQLLNAGTATCGFNVVDNVGQTAAMNATIGQTFVPSAAGMTTNFTSAGMAVPITVRERNYDLPGNGGGFTAGILSGPCTAVGPAGQSMSTDGTYTENETWSLTFSSAGTCAVRFTDTYGQTAVASDTVTQPMQSWPEQITMAAGGVPVSYIPAQDIDLAEILNFAIGGSIADAAATSGCYAYAYKTDGFTVDPAPSQANALGIYTDGNGCFTNAGGTPIANPQIALWEPSGIAKTFNIGPGTNCASSSVTPGAWNPGPSGSQVGLPLTPGSTPTGSGGCNIGITDGVTSPVVDHGLTNVQVIQPCVGLGSRLVGSTCYKLFATTYFCPAMTIFGTLPPCPLPDGTNDTTVNPGFVGYYYIPYSQVNTAVSYYDAGPAEDPSFAPACLLEEWALNAPPQPWTMFAWYDYVTNQTILVGNTQGLGSADIPTAQQVPIANAYALAPPAYPDPFGIPPLPPAQGPKGICKPLKGGPPVH